MAKNKICLFPPRVFLVKKPIGMHSGDVLKHFKYHLPKGFGKIGHLGTLDPFADGLLIIAIGQSARLSFLFEEFLTKTYFAKGVFHFLSTTGDSDGDISSMKVVDLPGIEDSVKELESFIGDYMQSPPHYSAAKHNGKALYEYAREGILIDKDPVLRRIYQIKDFQYLDESKKCSFEVEVSSGTYIRTLFEDIAKKLGSFGYLERLTRTHIGDVSLLDAMSKENWPIRGEDFNLMEKSICPSTFFNFERLVPESALLSRIENGQRIPLNELNGPELTDGDYVWIFSDDGMLRGLCFANDGVASPKVIFPKINQNN